MDEFADFTDTKPSADGETISGMFEEKMSSSCRSGSNEKANPYVTCEGYVAAAKEQAKAISDQWKVDVGIQAALALWDRKSSAAITGLQHKLADQQTKMAEELHEHAKKFIPYEIRFVQEAMVHPKYKAQYEATSEAWGGKMDEDLDEARNDFNNIMADLCLPINRCMDARWQREAGLRSADMRNYALRQEENRAQALNDQRYSWQYSALGLGRGKLVGIHTYASLAGAIGQNAAQFLMSGLTGLGSAVSNWVMSAESPKYSRADQKQVYIENVAPPETVPVKTVEKSACTKMVMTYVNDEFGNRKGRYEMVEVPCDKLPSNVQVRG